MPELRKDPITGTWVIISSERKKRPKYYLPPPEQDATSPETCPFCPGNEAMTPPEIAAYRPGGGPANGPGWAWRVFPNKFPALRVEGELSKSAEGFYDKMNGIGAHEVLVETARHGESLVSLEQDELQQVLAAMCNRILDLRRDIRLRYVMVFKNKGAAAGATLAHSHAQLIALPVIPIRVQEELQGAESHFLHKERCLFCDIISYESEVNRRVLWEDEHFIILAPYAPRFPFEFAVYPRKHRHAFENSSPQELTDLAGLLKNFLERIDKSLNQPDYNLILHNSPFNRNAEEYYHWHLEFAPILTRVAGFEWGSGFYINPVPPEEAVQVLKTI